MGGTSMRNRAVGLRERERERERGPYGKQLLRKLLGPFCMFSHWIYPPSNSKVSNGERLSAQQNSHMLKHREIKRAVGFCVLLPHDLVLLVIY